MDVSETASISSGIADRYATAVFEMVRDAGNLDHLSKDIAALKGALDVSDDLRAFLKSPLHSRADQEAAIAAVAQKVGLGQTMTNTLRLMAQKRRLFAVPQLLHALDARIADEKGIVTAEVTTVKELTKAQTEKLSAVLKAKVGKDVEIHTTIDESLIGGLIVKLGSKMIDTSIRSKLAALQNTMKEAG